MGKKKKKIKRSIIDDTLHIKEILRSDSVLRETLRFKTNGFQGGDAGHGGETVLEMEVQGHQAIFASVKGDNSKLRIKVQGDWELYSLMEFLKNANKFLQDNVDQKKV